MAVDNALIPLRAAPRVQRPSAGYNAEGDNLHRLAEPGFQGNALAGTPLPTNRLAPPAGFSTPPGQMWNGLGFVADPSAAPPRRAPAPPPPPAPPSKAQVVGAMASMPMQQLANVVSQHQLTTQEMIKYERRLTAVVRDITDLLRHKVITDADIAAAEKKAKRSGDHEKSTVDEFLQRLPLTSDQPRLRATLERERAAASKQIAALHIAAGNKGLDLAGLITSGARRS